jgi:hypothetical protein
MLDRVTIIFVVGCAFADLLGFVFLRSAPEQAAQDLRSPDVFPTGADGLVPPGRVRVGRPPPIITDRCGKILPIIYWPLPDIDCFPPPGPIAIGNQIGR